MTPYARKQGPLWPFARDELYDAQQEASEKSGVNWKRNACRHSFISYRLAQVEDAAKVALEAGNSPAIVFGHYRELVTSAEAERWFAVVPEKSANVIRLHKAKQEATLVEKPLSL